MRTATKTMSLLLVAALLTLIASCEKLSTAPATPATTPQVAPAPAEPAIQITDTVDMYFNQMHVFEGDTYRTEIHTRKPVIKRYQNKPIVQSLGAYILEEPGYPYIETIARQIYAPVAHKNLTDDQLRRYFISFTQNLPYEPDPAVPGGGDLIKNPLVSLYEPSDCEDHVLMAYVLLETFGLNECRALRIPYATPSIGHMALAVRVDKPIGRTYYEKSTGKYFAYVEVTGKNYPPGLIYPDYADKFAELVELPHIRPLGRAIRGTAPHAEPYANTIGLNEPEERAWLDYWVENGLATDVVQAETCRDGLSNYSFMPATPVMPAYPAHYIEGMMRELLSALFTPIQPY